METILGVFSIGRVYVRASLDRRGYAHMGRRTRFCAKSRLLRSLRVFRRGASISLSPRKRKVAKMRNASGGLVDLGVLVSPFGKLAGRANVRRWLQHAECAVAPIAAEDPADSLGELSGHAKETAGHIAESLMRRNAAVDPRATRPGSYALFA